MYFLHKNLYSILADNMIKIVFKISILLLVITTISCERDDICIEPTTPKLIVRFYDKNNHDNLKSVTNLQVEIDSLGVFIPYGETQTTDSIAIPLRIDIDYTKYRFIKEYGDATNEKTDEFTINYQRELQFVSRSCGYKTVFMNNTISNLSNNWIESISVNQQNILNEKEAHLTVYH